MYYRLVFPIFLLLCSCTTVEFVRKDTVPTKQGILRHLPPSSGDKEVKYRDEVKKKAQEFCGGDFTITKEYQALDESQSSTGIGIGTGFGYSSRSSVYMGGSSPARSMYSFVEFTCK